MAVGSEQKALKQKGRERQGMGAFLTPEYRLSALLTLLLALLAVFLFLLRTTPDGQRWLALWHAQYYAHNAQKQLQQALAKDPPIGFPLSKLGLSVSPSLSSSSLPLLIVVFGSCEGCGAGMIEEWARLGDWETVRKEVTLLLVFQEKAEKVREAARKGKWQVAAVADEEGKVAQALNAFFVPRSYGFVEGKLVWKQKAPNVSVVKVLEEFLTVVKGAEKAKAVLNAWSAEMREKA